MSRRTHKSLGLAPLRAILSRELEEGKALTSIANVSPSEAYFRAGIYRKLCSLVGTVPLYGVGGDVRSVAFVTQVMEGCESEGMERDGFSEPPKYKLTYPLNRKMRRAVMALVRREGRRADRWSA